MKIAITATEQNKDSAVNPRFGRAACFAVVDTETNEWSYAENSLNLNAVQGAGIQTAQSLSALGVDVVLTGNLGPKAFMALDAAEIKACLGVTGTLAEALAKYQAGDLVPTDSSNVEGHWM